MAFDNKSRTVYTHQNGDILIDNDQNNIFAISQNIGSEVTTSRPVYEKRAADVGDPNHYLDYGGVFSKGKGDRHLQLELTSGVWELSMKGIFHAIETFNEVGPYTSNILNQEISNGAVYRFRHEFVPLDSVGTPDVANTQTWYTDVQGAQWINRYPILDDINSDVISTEFGGTYKLHGLSYTKYIDTTSSPGFPADRAIMWIDSWEIVGIRQGEYVGEYLNPFLVFSLLP